MEILVSPICPKQSWIKKEIHNNKEQQILNTFRPIVKIFRKQRNVGLLQLIVKEPKTISIESGGVNKVFIERINGELKFN